MRWYGWLIVAGLVVAIPLMTWILTDVLPERNLRLLLGENKPADSHDSLNRPTGRLDGLAVTEDTTTQAVQWEFDGEQWVASGTAPACPSPLMLDSPVDLSRVTAILYPGQTRGGNYKPHGGFRFDGLANDAITVTAPLDAVVVNGARYIAEGDVQYTFDFVTSCGVMYRLGHLLTLTSKYQALADQFPPAVEGDSRTTQINPPVAVIAGEEIATAVGVTADTNTFVDWGVYDLRQKNAASADAAWQARHADDTHLAPYAVCWFDWLSAADEARVRALPAADSGSGTTSDYCN